MIETVCLRPASAGVIFIEGPGVLQMKKLEKPVAAIAALAFIVVLFTAMFEVACYGDFSYYQKEYEKYGVLDDVKMEMDDLMHVTREMMAYLRGDREVLSVETTVAGQKMDFFNEQDRIHMKDVQDLFIGGLQLRYICLAIVIVSVALLLVLKAPVKRLLPTAFLWSTAGLFAAILTVVICAMVDFTACFTVFHEIFFDNDLWIFDPSTDLMINVLVEEFFMDIAVRIVLFFAAAMAVVIAASVVLLTSERRKRRLAGNVNAAALCLAVCVAGSVLGCPATAKAAPTIESPVKELKTEHVDHDFSFPTEWPEAPEVNAGAAVLIEVTTGTVLYAKNADVELYPASMTKVMTGLLVAERANMNDMVTYSWDAVNLEAGAMHMGFQKGERLSVQESMYGMMLLSANDAANGLAEHVAGSMENFAVLMNKRAKEIGALNTHFSNPSGLFAPDHYTTCYDMALMLAEAIKNPTYLSICTTYHYTIEQTEDYKRTCYCHLSHYMKPGSSYEYEGFVCGKTGYVDESGNTLATYCERDGMKLIAVVMKDSKPAHYTDTIALMDYGFNNFKLNQIDGSLLSSEMSGGGYLGNQDLFEQSGFTIKENYDNFIVLPKDVDLSEVKCVLDYDLPEGEKKDGLIANIIYSYRDMIVGTGTLEFVKSDSDYQTPNEGERPTEDSTEEEGKNEIILSVGQVMLMVCAVIVVLLFIAFLIFYFQPKRVTARRIQRRRRARAKRYRMRRGWDKR